jgi:L-asparaginase / beta-aspartyl-peptidase
MVRRPAWEKSVMRHFAFLVPSVLALLAVAPKEGASSERSTPRVVLAIHGGAGVLPKKEMTPELKKKYEAELERALDAGYKALQKDGGTSLDAVESAIHVLEDSGLFNAGKGAVFTHEGRNELDASIMEGKEKRAGAVASVSRIKNPILAARKVLGSEHVLLVGAGAERFAAAQGVEEVNPVYFWTEPRWRQLQKALEEEKKGDKGARMPGPRERHLGTVGAVALDGKGNLAAGTSTGGMTNKRHGRVGDSPLIGAGTYADNAGCAVSATGHGELFIRYAVAHEIVALVKYKKLSVADAAADVLKQMPEEEGGVGGVIVLDAKGNLAMPYNTEGMYRGYVTSDGKIHLAIYED